MTETSGKTSESDKDLVSEGPSGPIALAALIVSGGALVLFFRGGLAGGVDAMHPPSIWAVNLSFCAILMAAVALYRIRRLPRQAMVKTGALAALLLGLAGPMVFFAQGMHWRNSIEGRELRQLSRIAQGARDYARAHGGKFPRDLLSMLAEGQIAPGDLISPFRATSPLGEPIAALRARLPAGLAEKEVLAHSDYVYLGAGIHGVVRPDSSWELDPHLIVAAAKTPEGFAFDKRLGDSITVAFASGDAKYVPAEKFEKVLAASNAAREKLHLPPLDDFGDAAKPGTAPAK